MHDPGGNTLALSLKLGTSLQQAGCPSPQPAWGPPSLPPSFPSLGRAVKLPAASKAYCSAVTRNGCRSTGRGKARAGKGEGRGGQGEVCRQGHHFTDLACLPRGARAQTHLPDFFFFFFSLVLSRCNCRWKCMPLCVLVRRARLPLEKDLWSLISQLGA